MKFMIPLMRRSAWKGPNVVNLPITDAIKNNTPVKTDARSCTILPQFIGLVFQIHNGKDYIDVLINENMVGRKLGEFAPTRKKFVYKYSKN